jgi:hypothetical protein
MTSEGAGRGRIQECQAGDRCSGNNNTITIPGKIRGLLGINRKVALSRIQEVRLMTKNVTRT